MKKKDDILMCRVILEEYEKTCRNTKSRLMSTLEDSYRNAGFFLFAAVSVAMFVVCRADKPSNIFRTKLPQMKQKSETSFSYQSERSSFGGGLFRLQSKIGLPINGTGNLFFDRKIRF